MHLLIPMSGQGLRYQKAGYSDPKPLISINGVPMIKRLLSNFPTRWPTHFVLAENHRSTQLPAVLKQCRPTGAIHYVPKHTQGPGHALEEGLRYIPSNTPVFVSYCDYGMIWSSHAFERFVRKSDCDACVISYRGFHAHYLSPVTYAYSRMEKNRVVEVREKGSFTSQRESEYASSGGYYFRTAEILKKALDYQKKENLSLNGEWYTSLTVQALLKMDPKANVRIFEIPGFLQWGTPQDLEIFEYWERTYRSMRKKNPRGSVQQILMPMAGLGSRFSSLTKIPKPFIKMEGKPVYQHALASLPMSKKKAIVTLETSRPYIRKAIFLSKTPPGQALSTAAGIDQLDIKKEVLVSACDHAILMGNIWKKFRSNPNCEAAIFTVRGYPGTHRNPNSYAYVRSDGKGTFPRILWVSVKNPISSTPSKDALLVGTFWFREGSILKEAIDELIRQDLRVNNELYLDSVFNILISKGKTVREIPLEGYINWGDPDALAESIYWKDVFFKRKRPSPRPRYPGVFK